MFLHQIGRPSSKKNKAIRRGRGDASGRGNYSGRGMKGQKARAGFSLHIGFEGGQTPLFQRLPKNKGFKRFFKHKSNTISLNLGKLEKDDSILSGDLITYDLLLSKGYIKLGEKVKILGHGDFTKKLNFSGFDLFSTKAKTRITDLGGDLGLDK